MNITSSTSTVRQLETQSSSLTAMLDQHATRSTPLPLNLYRISFDPHPHQAATATSNRGQERSCCPTFTSGTSTIISKNKPRMKRAVQWTVGCFIEEDERRLTTSTNKCCTKGKHEIRFEWTQSPALANCNSKCDCLLRVDGIVVQESAVLYDDILGSCLNHSTSSTSSNHKSRSSQSQSQNKLKLMIDFAMADHPRIPVQLRVTCHALFHAPKDHDNTSSMRQQEADTPFSLSFGGSSKNTRRSHRQYQQPNQKVISFGDLPQLKDVAAGTHLKITTSMDATVIGSNTSSNALSTAFLAEQQAARQRQPAETSMDLHDNYNAQRQPNRSAGENTKKTTAPPLLKRMTILKSTRKNSSSKLKIGQDVCISTDPSEPSVDLPRGGISSNRLVRMPPSTSVASSAATTGEANHCKEQRSPNNNNDLHTHAARRSERTAATTLWHNMARLLKTSACESKGAFPAQRKEEEEPLEHSIINISHDVLDPGALRNQHQDRRSRTVISQSMHGPKRTHRISKLMSMSQSMHGGTPRRSLPPKRKLSSRSSRLAGARGLGLCSSLRCLRNWSESARNLTSLSTTTHKRKCRSSPPSARNLDDDIILAYDVSALAHVVVDILANENDLKAMQRARAVLDKHIAERESNKELRRSNITNSSNANNSMDVSSPLSVCASFNTQTQVQGCGDTTRWARSRSSIQQNELELALLPVDDHDGPVLIPIPRCRKSLGCDEASSSSISDCSVASPLPLCVSFNTQAQLKDCGNKISVVASMDKSRSSIQQQHLKFNSIPVDDPDGSTPSFFRRRRGAAKGSEPLPSHSLPGVLRASCNMRGLGIGIGQAASPHDRTQLLHRQNSHIERDTIEPSVTALPYQTLHGVPRSRNMTGIYGQMAMGSHSYHGQGHMHRNLQDDGVSTSALFNARKLQPGIHSCNRRASRRGSRQSKKGRQDEELELSSNVRRSVSFTELVHQDGGCTLGLAPLRRRASQHDSKEQDKNNVFTASAVADIIQMTSPTDVHVAGSPARSPDAHHHNFKGNYKEGERETNERKGHYTASTGVAEKLEEDRRALQKRWQRGKVVVGQSPEESSQESSHHGRAYHQSVFCMQYSSSDSSSDSNSGGQHTGNKIMSNDNECDSTSGRRSRKDATAIRRLSRQTTGSSHKAHPLQIML
jgi:hypothetical protein